jgi:hypothetical protein
MNKTISQMFYPNRRAFFERIATSLSLQPMVKIGPAPVPGRNPGLRNLRKAVRPEKPSTAHRLRDFLFAKLRTQKAEG